jgi:hypothetical protein
MGTGTMGLSARGTGMVKGLLWRNLKIMNRFQKLRRNHHMAQSIPAVRQGLKALSTPRRASVRLG